MASKTIPIVALHDMSDNEEADIFVMMTSKEEATTKTGKPYFRVGFRDAQREVNFPVWNDSTWANACRESWDPGNFYKIRAVYRESSYGPQLEIKKIRLVKDDDAQDGFDELMCQPSSQFDSDQMLAQLIAIAKEEISDSELSALVLNLLESNGPQLTMLPAATYNHHAFVGGYLEHVLSVTQNAKLLSEKYCAQYPQMNPPLSHDLVMAGAILHDIGKVYELELGPAGAEYSPQGELIGHILLGRDMVREAAAEHNIDPDTLLRLEHIIVSHQRLPEWGSPKPPMTPEALLIHYADDLDAKYQMMVAALNNETGDTALTSKKNPLRLRVFRGLRS